MTIYLVRHGKAGERARWPGDDDLRPLSKPGRRQADAVADLLEGAGVTRMMSSPFVRCRQTLTPLADRLRLPIDLADALTEGAPLRESLRLLEKVVDEEAVLCTHGDVLEHLLKHLAASGAAVARRRPGKGSVWVLDVADGEITGGHCLAPAR